MLSLLQPARRNCAHNWCFSHRSSNGLCEPLPLIDPWLESYDLTQYTVQYLSLCLTYTTHHLRQIIGLQLNERLANNDDLNYSFAAAHQLGAQYAALAFITGKLNLDVRLDTPSQPTLLLWHPIHLV